MILICTAYTNGIKSVIPQKKLTHTKHEVQEIDYSHFKLITWLGIILTGKDAFLINSFGITILSTK